MKTQHLTSSIAISALLPLAAWGGDAGTKNAIQREAYDPRPSETRSGPPSARMEDPRDETTRSTTHAQTDMDAPHARPTDASGAGIERVTKDQLEQRVTASDLIGTKVLDREGREIGKVKDVGLGSAAPQLADTRPVRDPASSGSPSSGLSQPWTQTDDREARVFVRPDRALDAGDALVAIPAAQLHREGDALRVDISREELRSIVADRSSSRVSMNP